MRAINGRFSSRVEGKAEGNELRPFGDGLRKIMTYDEPYKSLLNDIKVEGTLKEIKLYYPLLLFLPTLLHREQILDRCLSELVTIRGFVRRDYTVGALEMLACIAKRCGAIVRAIRYFAVPVAVTMLVLVVFPIFCST